MRFSGQKKIWPTSTKPISPAEMITLKKLWWNRIREILPKNPLVIQVKEFYSFAQILKMDKNGLLPKSSPPKKLPGVWWGKVVVLFMTLKVCVGVSLNGGTPISHPKCWSFLVEKPMVVGETHHFRKPPCNYCIFLFSCVCLAWKEVYQNGPERSVVRRGMVFAWFLQGWTWLMGSSSKLGTVKSFFSVQFPFWCGGVFDVFWISFSSRVSNFWWQKNTVVCSPFLTIAILMS